MIKEWISKYNPKNEQETLSALRKIMQEVTLAGLSRTDFFEKAAFYGRTALRIFHNLDRFSEDLDFSLLKEDPKFSLETYFNTVIIEFEALGMKVSIKEKIKTAQTNVESDFLKSVTICKELVLEETIKQFGIKSKRGIKIKIEIDRKPPLGFNTEEKLLLRPFSFYVKCFDLSSLFAGKMHALLFRKWKNRVKGRYWYDLEWYIKKGVPLNLEHFLKRAQETGDWSEKNINAKQIKYLLKNKIKIVSFKNIREDVARFIKNDKSIEIWSPNYFNDLIEKLKFD